MTWHALSPAFAGVDVEVGQGEQGVDVPRVVVQQGDEVVGVVRRPRALERPLRVRIVRVVHVPDGWRRGERVWGRVRYFVWRASTFWVRISARFG